MPTIDAQVHAYERDRPERPWHAVLEGPPAVTGDDMVAAMDAVGVDGAILVSVFTMYRFDDSYAREVRLKHPGRFALVKPVNTADPRVADVIDEWAALDGTVGIRIMLAQDAPDDAEDPGIRTVLESAARHSLPVNLSCSGRLDQVGTLAAKYPNTRLVVDHLGIMQPRRPPVPEKPFAALPNLLGLAAYYNVAVKVSGAGTLSREPFPYRDIWDPLARVFDAFGFQRCMWGTDWTRAIHMLSYEQGVEAFRVTDRLSDSERDALMGGTLTQIYGWAPGAR
jgi:L-fuconolactonase